MNGARALSNLTGVFVLVDFDDNSYLLSFSLSESQSFSLLSYNPINIRDLK